MKRMICVHGHFYQPPREDPWTRAVPNEPSASPFDNWNSRITEECYRPMGCAKVHATERHGERVINNYEWMNFNIGPTLLRWLATEAPEVIAKLKHADQASIERWGAGNAIAQSYHHAILPLCTERDRRTELEWSKAVFRQTFGRDPEGLWLPEAAVDLATLESVARAGFRFVILAPRQCKAVRAPGATAYRDVSGVETARAYGVPLPSGRKIAAFFYHGPLSQAVAFEQLLDDGERFAQRLRGEALRSPVREGLTHIATDGESYGHHHRFGEMALAYALMRLTESDDVALTNYSAYLNAHPAQWDALIHEPSSWSCAHGVERWRSNCGCGMRDERRWTHGWRVPLRAALETLRDQIAFAYERALAPLVRDCWQLRDEYEAAAIADLIDPLLDAHAVAPLADDERTRLYRWLSLQRDSLAMFASCGWFFDDPIGLEPTNNLKTAARAIEQLEELSGEEVGEEFFESLRGWPTAGNAAPAWREHILGERPKA
ncbi:MAG: alpha-amylase/alpha-mannosidase (GH57 family) [Bradymonadia bacterium]|jgi:alpha-amylase/alpha-mannosidase (GH57 family)